MKIFYLFLFLFLLSCSTSKKEYVCGNRLCVDKKEFNEYFSKNLSVEISTEEDKKDQVIDLAKLNLSVNKKSDVNSKKKVKIKKKENKDRLKAEKKKLLEQRRIKKQEEKIKLKEAKKNIKSSRSNTIEKKIIDKEVNNNKKTKNIDNKITQGTVEKKLDSNEEFKINSVMTDGVKSLCVEIKDCDIDKIAEILVKKGKNKPYPDIASN